MFRKKMIGLIILVIMALPVWAMAAENPQTPAGPEILSLRQCLETALKNNKQIQAKEKEVTIAESTVKEAEAGFQPTVNYQAERDQSDVAQYQVGPAYEKTDFTAGVFLSVPLYTGGMLRNNLKLARLQLEAAGEGLRKAKQQLTYDVKQAYYNVWLAEQIVRVQESSYRNMDEHVSRMESRYRAEVASKLDVLRATVQRDTLKPKVINAKNQLALAKLQLATIIDFSKDKPFEVQYDIYELKMPEAIEISLTKILDEAYLDRPEIRQIAQLAEINQVVTAMKQAGYRPNLILAAGYGGERKDILSDEEWYGAWMLTLTVGGKIFDRAIQERVEQAKGKEELTAIQKLDLRDKIRLEAEQSLQNLEVSIENTHASQAGIDLAQETLRMTKIRFDSGMATTMDIMDSQLALDQTLTNYYQGVVSYLIAEAKMDLVAGKD